MVMLSQRQRKDFSQEDYFGTRQQRRTRMNTLKFVLAILVVACLHTACFAPPCSWVYPEGRFANGCVYDGTCADGFGCEPMTWTEYNVCYTNGRGCCLCTGWIWKCQCLFGIGTYYQLYRYQYSDSACDQSTPIQHCEAINP